MLILTCPHCGPREERELVWGGEAGIARPDLSCDDVTWTDYLFFRANPKGVVLEQWCCAAGCGQWFKVARNTLTHEVLGTWPHAADPDLDALGKDEAQT